MEYKEEEEHSSNEYFKDLVKEVGSIVDTCQEVKSQISIIQNQIREIQKDVNKKVNNLEKTIEKKTKKKPQNHQFGFASPSGISVELCNFLGQPEGTKLARTDVTKQIVKYIKEKELQDKSDGRKIIPDKALRSLLGDTENVTYFNLQSHMNKHFINKE